MELINRLDHCRQIREGEWIARCPAHEDKSPSLTVRALSDGRTLVHCFAGCGALDVLTAVGMDWTDLFPPDDNYRTLTQRSRRDKTVDELVIEIAVADMNAGKRLSEADKQRARQAMLRVDTRQPSPDPDNMERNAMAVAKRYADVK